MTSPRLLTALGCLLALAVVPAPASSAPSSPVCIPRASAPPVGLRLQRSDPVPGHPRVSRLTFTSAAMAGPVQTQVVLPPGFSARGATRYPVLFLLHGHGGNEGDWVEHGADSVVGNRPWIVVAPEGGHDGFYSDWYGTNVDGTGPKTAPAWETFHLRELLPWVDAHYPTLATRAGRAIAGLSMGGFGASSYAARHPDLFAAVATFSGAVNPDILWPPGAIATSVVSNAPDRPDFCIWGDPITQNVVWRTHDPVDLVGNLRGVSVTLMTGDGRPGPHDDPANPDLASMFVEFGCQQMNTNFDTALTAAGIEHTTSFYGPGTHIWPYWIDDLRAWLPAVDKVFAKRAPAPAVFDYSSAEPHFDVYGWSFVPKRDVMEFTYLTEVSAAGFDVTGSGVLDVVTAPIFRAGRYYTVGGSGKLPKSLVAGADRRIRFSVDLGPSHTTQQYVFDPAARTSWTTASVRITPN